MTERIIPVELETGIPLAIAPSENSWPPPNMPNEGADWHHAVFPKDRKELQTPSGFAMRQARVQWVDEEDQHGFHHYFDGFMANEWEFPRTISQRFGMVVMLAARYVPELAIKVERSGPSYVKVTEKERQQMWDTGILRAGSESVVYEFLKDEIAKQKKLKDPVHESSIQEFLTTKDDERRVKIGNELLKIAAKMATQDIKPVYIKARKRGLLTPDMPREPQELVLDHPSVFGTVHKKRQARKALRRHLAGLYGVDLSKAA